MRAIGAVGVALVALTVLILPSSVLAQAVDEEYSLNIPGASSGGGQSGSSNGNGPAGQIPPESGEQATPAVSSTPADDSAAPILLIVLAVIAALCTAAAIWRLRTRAEGDPHGLGDGAGTAGVTGETSSL